MSEITFRAATGQCDELVIQERDQRIRELEELLREAQEIASVGRVDNGTADIKAKTEIEYLRKRKAQLSHQLNRLQEEFLAATMQFDQEINELRHHIEACELKVKMLTERTESSTQSNGRNPKAVSTSLHFERISQKRRLAISSTNHYLVPPPPPKKAAFAIDQYNNKIYIRKLALLNVPASDAFDEENALPRQIPMLSRSTSESLGPFRAFEHSRKQSLFERIHSTNTTPRGSMFKTDAFRFGSDWRIGSQPIIVDRMDPPYATIQMASSLPILPPTRSRSRGLLSSRNRQKDPDPCYVEFEPKPRRNRFLR